jgi:DNA invertase Pin-like site-specific DNA recombinase
MNRTLSYLRVSSKGQIDGDGFSRQRETIEQWALKNGAIIMGEFREEGVSGTTELVSRPALTRLTQRILEGGVDTVVVEKADRLARDLIVSELLIRQFGEMGVKVIEAEGGNDLTAGSDNPTAKLIRQVLGALAEFEKSSIVAKLRTARNRIRCETGRCEGNKPYGYNEEEAKVVRTIWNLHIEGVDSRGIAQYLEDRGVRARSGKPFSFGVVARVISRERKKKAFSV